MTIICPECDYDDILIVTPAIHTGFLINNTEDIDALPAYHNIPEGSYVAYNNDNSWRIDDSSPIMFVCDACDHKWPADKSIYWIWMD